MQLLLMVVFELCVVVFLYFQCHSQNAHDTVFRSFRCFVWKGLARKPRIGLFEGQKDINVRKALMNRGIQSLAYRPVGLWRAYFGEAEDKAGKLQQVLASYKCPETPRRALQEVLHISTLYLDMNCNASNLSLVPRVLYSYVQPHPFCCNDNFLDLLAN